MQSIPSHFFGEPGSTPCLRAWMYSMFARLASSTEKSLWTKQSRRYIAGVEWRTLGAAMGSHVSRARGEQGVSHQGVGQGAPLSTEQIVSRMVSQILRRFNQAPYQVT